MKNKLLCAVSAFIKNVKWETWVEAPSSLPPPDISNNIYIPCNGSWFLGSLFIALRRLLSLPAGMSGLQVRRHCSRRSGIGGRQRRCTLLNNSLRLSWCWLALVLLLDPRDLVVLTDLSRDDSRRLSGWGSPRLHLTCYHCNYLNIPFRSLSLNSNSTQRCNCKSHISPLLLQNWLYNY